MVTRRRIAIVLVLFILLALMYVGGIFFFQDSPSEDSSTTDLLTQPIDGVYLLDGAVELTLTNTLATSLTLTSVTVRNPLVGSCQGTMVKEILANESVKITFPCDQPFTEGQALGVTMTFTEGTFGGAKWAKLKP